MDTDLWFYQSSVRTLENLADYLIAVPDRRKSVFWVSPGVPMDFDPVVPRISRRHRSAGQDMRRQRADPWALKRRDASAGSDGRPRAPDRRVFRRAQRANVTIYPIDPTGLGGMHAYLRARLGQWNAGFSAHKATAQQDYLAAAAANTGGRTS